MDTRQLSQQEIELLDRICDALDSAGPQGLTDEQLATALAKPVDLIRRLLDRL